MKIQDLQDKDAYTQNGNNELWLKLISNLTEYRNENKVDEAHYHSQLSLCYSHLFMPEECKKHAALVPDYGSAFSKAEALTAVARMLVYEKKIEEALDCYKQAHALDNESEVDIEEAGWCCFELKRWEEAQEWFTKGTMLPDEMEIFWEGLGHSLGKQEKYEEALPVFKKAFELCNKEREGYYYDYLIGQCYANLNDFYRALGYYTKSLDANPTHAKALNDMAALYFNQEGDMKNAIGYLKKAEAIAEKSEDKYVLQLIYINLSKIYAKIKEFKLHEYYQAKLMETLGFDFEVDDDDDDE